MSIAENTKMSLLSDVLIKVLNGEAPEVKAPESIALRIDLYTGFKGMEYKLYKSPRDAKDELLYVAVIGNDECVYPQLYNFVISETGNTHNVTLSIVPGNIMHMEGFNLMGSIASALIYNNATIHVLDALCALCYTSKVYLASKENKVTLEDAMDAAGKPMYCPDKKYGKHVANFVRNILSKEKEDLYPDKLDNTCIKALKELENFDTVYRSSIPVIRGLLGPRMGCRMMHL